MTGSQEKRGMKTEKSVIWRVGFLGVGLFLLSVVFVNAQIYQYRDKNGEMHFTNQLTDVPEGETPKEIMKPPKNPEESAESKKKESEPGQTKAEEGDQPAERSAKTDAPEVPEKIPIVEDLNKEKAALDRTHARLMKRKKALKKEKESLKTAEQVRIYRKKVEKLNRDIDKYKKRNRTFQKKVDVYNAAVREKGEE